MSHFLTFVTDANGTVVDPHMPDEVATAMSSAFGFNDVFMYSHGWSTDASGALQDYNRFSIGCANRFRLDAAIPGAGPVPPSLGVGIHWPSEISEDNAVVDLLQAATFFQMENRADDVGEGGVFGLLKMMVDSRNPAADPLTINLLGHSFGCKVICAALQKLIVKCGPLASNIRFRVVLLQAAFEQNDLEAGQSYGALASVASLRMLITKSSEDKALGNLFPLAHALEFFGRDKTRVAMGFAGPTDQTFADFGADSTRGAASIAPASIAGNPCAGFPALTQRITVADLQKLHQANASPEFSGISGHHSDIYRDEIYCAIGRFIAS